LNWYQVQLKNLGVTIELRHQMSAAEVQQSGVDSVVICTGSTPSRTGFQRVYADRDSLPGVDQENVCTVHDVLDGSVIPCTNVLLLDDIDGWWPATGTALHLAEQRHYVTIVTASEKAANKLDICMMGDTTRERLSRFGIEVVLATSLESWDGETATLVNLYSGEKEEREFESLVLATTNTSNNQLFNDLEKLGIKAHQVGDAVAARTAHMAIFEARKLGLTL
jgi:hypothetical protein